MIENLSSRNDYVGNNSTAVYSYTFRILHESQLKVYVQTVDPETPPQLLSLNTDYTVQGVGRENGTVTLLGGNLETDYKLAILLNVVQTQDTNFTNQGSFFPQTHEDTFDYSRIIDQQQQEEIDRSVKLNPIKKVSNFDPTLPLDIDEEGEDRFLKVKDDGTGFELASAGGGDISGDDIEIGTPTDGYYGDPVLGDPTGLVPTDLLPDGLDKIVSLLAILAPQPPQMLSAKILQVIGQYLAKAASTGDDHICTDDTTPTIAPNGSIATTFANSFRDAKSGTLSAEIDSIEVGSVVLTGADDTGVYGELDVVADFDPYAGQAGKEGIFFGLVAAINSAALSVGQHFASLIHTITGQTDLEFYVDDPTTPSISAGTLGFTGTSSYKSGVPGAAAGQNIEVDFDVTNFCGTHYNPTVIAAAISSQTGAQVNAPLGGPYTSGSTFNASINLPVQSGQYSENVSVTKRAYNSRGTMASSSITNNVRVDTVGTETRVLSSTGQYPASGYGGAFNSQTDVLSGNKELQFSNGAFRYPPLTDYTGRIPSGPDYSSLTPDAHNSMRWATFNLGSVSSASFKTFTINGAVNFGGTALVTGIELYLKVEGATGWLNANGAYPGVGDPSSNGDGALDVGSSTATSKRVTFGATVRSGTVYVRIGIPSGSNKTFTGMT